MGFLSYREKNKWLILFRGELIEWMDIDICNNYGDSDSSCIVINNSII
jgi:hypothetical protein